MPDDLKPTTSAINARLWGARAQDWADIQEPMARPAYEAVLKHTRVGPGTRYLDIGCGSGVAAQIAASHGAQVSGLDAADNLLTFARSRVPQGDFRPGDLEALPFAGATFDVTTGFNSFQFAGNPVVALKEARRVTKPDGIVAVMTWGNPEGMEAVAVITALRPLLPPPPPGAPGPFALSDKTALLTFATGAGLTPIEVLDVDSPYIYPDETTALRGLNSSGVAVRAMENSSEQAVTEAHAKTIAPFRQPDGRYQIGASFRCLLARP